MREARERVAERPEQQDVLGRVRQVVLAADDVADLHRGVVDDDREVVERRAVGADDDEVATEVRDIDLDVAADDVVERDDPLPDAEAERALRVPRPRGPAAPRRSGARSGRRSAAAAWPPPAPCGRRRAPRACSSTGRRGPRRAAAARPRRSDGRRCIWRYGRVRAARRLAGDLRPLVPIEAQPVQAVEDVLLELGRVAGDVGVLEAEDERAADVAGVQVVVERRPGRADVQRPGRARGDPDADRRHSGAVAASSPRQRRARGTPVEEGRVGVARQHPDERRRAQAEGRPTERPIEGQRVERLGAGEDRDRGARLERPRLEVRQQPGVLLGLLGDAVDRGAGPGLDVATGGRPGGRRLAVAASIGLPCGQVSGWPSSSSRRASTRGEMAPWRRIASSSDSAQPRPTTLVSSHSMRACRRKIASAAARRRSSAAARGRRHVIDQAVRDESAEHLAGGLGGDARGGGRPPAAVTFAPSPAPAPTRRASRYSWAAVDRSRGSWRRGMPSGYGTGRSAGRRTSRDERRGQTRRPRRSTSRPPAPHGAAPGSAATRSSRAGAPRRWRRASVATVATVATRASRGTSSSTASTATWATRLSGATRRRDTRQRTGRSR